VWSAQKISSKKTTQEDIFRGGCPKKTKNKSQRRRPQKKKQEGGAFRRNLRRPRTGRDQMKNNFPQPQEAPRPARLQTERSAHQKRSRCSPVVRTLRTPHLRGGGQFVEESWGWGRRGKVFRLFGDTPRSWETIKPERSSLRAVRVAPRRKGAQKKKRGTVVLPG